MAEKKQEPKEIITTLPDAITTTGDVIRMIFNRMKAVEDGNMPHDTCKLLQRDTFLILKTAELTIRASRETRHLRSRGREMNILTGGVEQIGSEDKVI